MDLKMNFGNYMYISTISSITSPLKIKIVPGEYTLREHELEGHILAKADYVPKIDDICKILNDRDGDPGFLGTYHDGGSQDPVLLDYLNTYFKTYLTDDVIKDLKDYYEDEDDFYDNEYFDSEDSDYEGSSYNVSEFNDSDDDDDFFNRNLNYEGLNYVTDSDCEHSDQENINDEGYYYKHVNIFRKYTKIRNIPDYNNIPIMFYSKVKLPHTHLRFFKWCKIEKADIVVWKIKHPTDGLIGIAVQQPCFFNMMGDQMGLAVYSENEYDALGFANFNIYSDDKNYLDEDRFEPMYKSKLQYTCAE